MEEMRLQKYLATNGVASRRKAEEYILAGRVSVNGILIKELGTKVNEKDVVEVDNKLVKGIEKKIYIMLNKPVDYITSSNDQFRRPTVLDLVKEIKTRIYPVGRLDYDTSGLIILTNDGEFTFKLTHPKHETRKVYIAEIEGTPDEEDISKIKTGIDIEGSVTSPAGFEIIERKTTTSIVKISIHEGRNRQIRKMCGAIHHPVKRLERVSIGDVVLGDLPVGRWRYLSEDEIRRLG